MSQVLFTPDELQQIRQAVEEAEQSSAGEIVPVFAKQSSFYEAALWRGGFIFATATGIVLSLFYLLTDFLLWWPPYLWLLIVLTGGLLGTILVLLSPAFRRALLSRTTLEDRVLTQAKDAFYNYNVSMTEQRTGILLYVSFFEHQAVVLADVGITELVPTEAWQEIIAHLTDGLRQGQKVESIGRALAECGRLLETSGVQKAADDDNELPNDVRVNA